MSKPKIKIVQYMSGERDYFPLSEWINRRYAEKHGYEYVYPFTDFLRRIIADE